MGKLSKFVSILLFTTFIPSMVYAQIVGVTCYGFNCILFRIQELFNNVIPVLIALGVVYFVWGVVQYVIYSDEEAKKAGKMRMIYGIIGLAVIVSLWGLVYIVVNTFNLNDQNNIAPTPGELYNILPRLPVQ
ncbi:MAG: pilin [Candidatus Paceibacterota bacterium]